MCWRDEMKPRRQFLKHALLLALGLPFALPLLWMIVTSLKPDDQIFSDPFSQMSSRWHTRPMESARAFFSAFVPSPPDWGNYADAMRFVPFLTYLKNTVFLCVANVFATTLSCSLVAYGFAKIPFRGRNALFLVLISTMILPPQVTMIPTFLLFSWLGWYGTFLPLIVPHFFGSAFFVFLLRQFYLTIPQELSDAARIDGCSEWGIWWRIMLPLSKPALATVALFTFLGTWNDFNGPLIYLNDQRQYTVAYGLQQFLGAYGSKWAELMAASAVFTAPIILLFFFTQKTFIRGIATTGLKG